MSDEIVFDRPNGLLPSVVGEGKGLRLEFAGGADALHDRRTFSIPIRQEHLAVLRADLARHLILWSVLGPLCDAAGVRSPLDEGAAVALLDPILLARSDEVDVLLQRTKWERALLVAHGADVELLRSGRIVASLNAATDLPDWQRSQEDEADRRRTRRGVTLAPLDAAVLKFTGQYLHGSTIPHRDPGAVEPELLPAVLRVIATAESACTGRAITRDPRRGRTGTDTQEWKQMEAAVDAAVRFAYPELAGDAVRTVSFLMCSEAAALARRRPFDSEADVPRRERTLTFTDDLEVVKTWNPGDDPTAVEAFWQFVAERINSRNQVFTLEDEALGEGVQLHFHADSIARVKAVSGATGQEYRVEYGLVDDLAHYRALVRGCIAGGFDGLDGRARWLSDNAEFEEARRQRDVRRRASP